MNTEFSEQKYGETGVKTSFEQMANGEQKYKMTSEDGSYGDDQMFSIRVTRAGEHIIVQPGIHHNIYMSAHSSIHTIKHGLNTSSDWTASPELDRLTQSLTEEELLQKYD
ncbi:hypothetical protein [Paenibacillus xylanexedens]|uniref:Cupin superfamily acireductone dioxygenase involved in methionine salvage n=1 Tax=Paenibacillus xylanexedens TaxID=528191 RepID=A0ABS4RQU7_PAEXY|nr:hypothetical protein [Paenibacillus xylanexedens]MBP2244172.1 cupin superfamily acireductone dioxygenase involved in methionine salvage [Paenibacillus xylanexedens]